MTTRVRTAASVPCKFRVYIASYFKGTRLDTHAQSSVVLVLSLNIFSIDYDYDYDYDYLIVESLLPPITPRVRDSIHQDAAKIARSNIHNGGV